MSQLDEPTIVRLMEVAEERDLAFVRVRVGTSELTIARVPPAELDLVDLSAPVRARPVERDDPSEARRDLEPPSPAAGAPPQPEVATSPASEAGGPAEGGVGDTIDAPMVGAFYRAPAPDQAPFVEIGSVVEVGDTVGLVEAMKVFTAVPATHAGVVREILVENGAFVEFGQPLMRVEPTAVGRDTERPPHG